MAFPIELSQCICREKIVEEGSQDSSNLKGLYLIQDPFDLREKIIPILVQTNSHPEVWKGLATVIKVNGC